MSIALLSSPLLIASVVLMAGCDGGVTVTSIHTIGSMTGRLIGGVSPGGEVDCIWIEDRSGHHVSVFWPGGWDEVFRPLRLYDDHRQIVAGEGDLLAITGPIDAVGDSICSSGSIFVAERVEVVARAGGKPATPP